MITKADLEQPWMQHPSQRVIAAALAEVGYLVIPPSVKGAVVGLPIGTPADLAYRARAMAQLLAGGSISSPTRFLGMWTDANPDSPVSDAELRSMEKFYALHGRR